MLKNTFGRYFPVESVQACPLRFTAGVLRKGEVRYVYPSGYTWGSTPTRYAYTGQYSNVAEFGLMYYNARWYDPYITHFSQPDSIIPNPGNVLDWNRYSYVRYNPIRYNDPSGHRPDCEEPSECKEESKNASLLIFKSDPGQSWTDAEENILNSNAQAVARALAREINKENWMLWKSGDIDSYSSITSTQAFYKTFGGSIVARRSSYTCASCWAMHQGKIDGHYEIWIYSSTSSSDIINHPLLFTHEIGHAFDVARGIDAGVVVPNNLLRPTDSNGIVGRDANGEYYGYFGAHYQWQFGRDSNNRSGEEFADMFVGWVYNQWEDSDLGTQRQEFMNTLMVNYLP